MLGSLYLDLGHALSRLEPHQVSEQVHDQAQNQGVEPLERKNYGGAHSLPVLE